MQIVFFNFCIDFLMIFSQLKDAFDVDTKDLSNLGRIESSDSPLIAMNVLFNSDSHGTRSGRAKLFGSYILANIIISYFF